MAGSREGDRKAFQRPHDEPGVVLDGGKQGLKGQFALTLRFFQHE